MFIVLYDKCFLCYTHCGDFMLIKILRVFARFFRIKKETLKQFEKMKLKPFVREQLVPEMKNGTFEAYHIRIFGKNAAQAYIFYDLDNKSLADGKNTCYVCNVFVHPKLRRLGFCTRCMQTLMQVAKRKGFSKMMLGVMEDNTNARSLYKKIGFVETGEKYGYDAVIVDRSGKPIPQKEYLLMCCEL